MSHQALEQKAYVIMRDGCSVRISIEQEDFVEISCGREGREQFEFVLYREVLREIVKLGGEALRKMDACA